MLKTKYSGQITFLGVGRVTGRAFSKRSYIKVGSERISDVFVSDDLDSYLHEIDPSKPTQLYFGYIGWSRWLLAVVYPDETFRQGFVLFVIGIFFNLVCCLFFAVIVGGIVALVLNPVIGLVVGAIPLLFSALTTVLNIRAWLGLA